MERTVKTVFSKKKKKLFSPLLTLVINEKLHFIALRFQTELKEFSHIYPQLSSLPLLSQANLQINAQETLPKSETKYSLSYIHINLWGKK